MTPNVLVLLRAKPGQRAALRTELRRLHARLPTLPGFVAITLSTADPETVIELETWRHHDDHRAFVELFDAAGEFNRMMELVASEPETHYLSSP